MKKKIISALLALCLLTTAYPAHAESGADDASQIRCPASQFNRRLSRAP